MGPLTFRSAGFMGVLPVAPVVSFAHALSCAAACRAPPPFGRPVVLR